MSEWKKIGLGKLAEIQTGPFGSQLHQEDYVPVGTPLITVKNLGENKVTYNKLDFVSDQDKERLSKFILQEGDIVFSRVGYVDRRAFITKKESGWLFSGSTLRVRVKETSLLNPKYLSYYFGQKKFKEYIKNMSVGATRPSLNTQLLEELEIITPSLPEQLAIASVLSSLDDKIDLLHRQNKTLESMAKTLFRQWFVEEADEGWEECTLNDLCTQIASGGTPSTKIESYYNGDINWYSTKELKDNFLYESENKITKEGLENSSAKLFPAGTVVIAIYAAPTVGRLGILANEASFNQAACGLIANEELCCSEFIYLYLKNQRDELNLMASGSAQQNLNVGKIKSFPAFKVQKDLMNKFKDAIQPNFKKINSNTLQISTLEKLRDTLLPKLMSGEVGVKYEKEARVGVR